MHIVVANGDQPSQPLGGSIVATGARSRTVVAWSGRTSRHAPEGALADERIGWPEDFDWRAGI
jgi:hypothetical protein